GLELAAECVLIGQRDGEGRDDIEHPHDEAGEQPGESAGARATGRRGDTHAEPDEAGGDDQKGRYSKCTGCCRGQASWALNDGTHQIHEAKCDPEEQSLAYNDRTVCCWVHVVLLSPVLLGCMVVRLQGCARRAVVWARDGKRNWLLQDTL